MKTLAILVLLLAAAWPSSALAQRTHDPQKTFTVGEPVYVQAVFCYDLESAKLMADRKMSPTDLELRMLLITGKCALLRGTVTYVQEIYRNGEWGVWEASASNYPKIYEATDWKPKKKGVDT